MDADTLMTGPVLDVAASTAADFLVDDEVQPLQRLKEIYYDPAKLESVAPGFEYPGYSFNTGQWFGTSGCVHRDDFAQFLEWSERPRPLFPGILFIGEQGILNLVLQQKEQQQKLSIKRKKIMIWPDSGNADHLDLCKIEAKENSYPYIIHWAGMRYRNITELPRYDIIPGFSRTITTAFPAKSRHAKTGCIPVISHTKKDFVAFPEK